MLPLRRSKSLCIREADPAVSLIGISLQQAPAVLLIHDGVDAHGDTVLSWFSSSFYNLRGICSPLICSTDSCSYFDNHQSQISASSLVRSSARRAMCRLLTAC